MEVLAFGGLSSPLLGLRLGGLTYEHVSEAAVRFGLNSSPKPLNPDDPAPSN